VRLQPGPATLCDLNRQLGGRVAEAEVANASAAAAASCGSAVSGTCLQIEDAGGCRAGAERVQSGCRAGAERVHALGCGEGAEKAGTLRGVPERNAVDAVALARGHRAIGEAVAQMATALLAHNLPRATAQGARRATTRTQLQHSYSKAKGCNAPPRAAAPA